MRAGLAGGWDGPLLARRGLLLVAVMLLLASCHVNAKAARQAIDAAVREDARGSGGSLGGAVGAGAPRLGQRFALSVGPADVGDSDRDLPLAATRIGDEQGFEDKVMEGRREAEQLAHGSALGLETPTGAREASEDELEGTQANNLGRVMRARDEDDHEDDGDHEAFTNDSHVSDEESEGVEESESEDSESEESESEESESEESESEDSEEEEPVSESEESESEESEEEEEEESQEAYDDRDDQDDDDDDDDDDGESVEENERLVNFFILSDIHLDLMYSADEPATRFCRNATVAALFNATGSTLEDECGSEDYFFDASRNYEYGRFGCDPPPQLLAATLGAMAALDDDPAFILLTGDYVGHCQLRWEDTYAAVENVTAMVKLFFPNTPVLPVLGNNELHPHNQLPLGQTEVLAYYSDLFEDWLVQMGPSEKDNYAWGGFFSGTPVPGIRVLGFNSIYYGTKWCATNATDCSKADRLADQDEEGPDPQGQLAWMEQELLAAEEAGERVLIAGHISPGRARGFKDLWQSRYQDAFLEVTRAHHEVIEAMFFGHIHRDSYLIDVLTTDDDDQDDDDDGEEGLTTMYVNSAVSPRSDNFPTFRRVELDLDSLQIADYVQYTLDLLQVMESGDEGYVPLVWQEEYRFSTEYGEGPPSDASSLALYHSMRKSHAVFHDWQENWGSRSPQVTIDHDDQEFLCGIAHIANSEYARCSAIDDDS